MRRSVITLLLLAIGTAFPATANEAFASPWYARGAAAYLDLPCNAQSAALSQAVTAWRPDLAGSQYNPAVYEAARGFSIQPSYTFAGDDRRLTAIEAAGPLGGYVVLGASVVSAVVDGIERRDEFGLLSTSEPLFSDRENGFAIAVAGRTVWNIAVGGRLRYLYQRLDKSTAHGFGFDAGGTWEPDSHICVGVSVLNMGSKLWWGRNFTNGDEVITQGRIGIAGLFLDRSLIIELDAAKPISGPFDVSLGAEYTALKVISIRLGGLTSVDYRSFSSRNVQVSAGLGITWSIFTFDYGIILPTDDFGLTAHKVSLMLQSDW